MTKEKRIILCYHAKTVKELRALEIIAREYDNLIASWDYDHGDLVLKPVDTNTTNEITKKISELLGKE